MKKSALLILALVLSLSTTDLLAQQRGRGGRGGGGRGGGRGAAAPEAPAPYLELANNIVAAVNGQDADALSAMLAADTLYLDEDGHAIPASVWVMRLTGTAKEMAISDTHGQMWGDTGWLSFNYTLGETFQGNPATLRGTASMVLRNNAGSWQIAMVHGALEQHVAGLTQ
jgi:ketosteroid isomerase-like protein